MRGFEGDEKVKEGLGGGGGWWEEREGERREEEERRLKERMGHSSVAQALEARVGERGKARVGGARGRAGGQRRRGRRDEATLGRFQPA